MRGMPSSGGAVASRRILCVMAATASMCFASATWAQDQPNPPILVVGASYGNGSSPVDDNLMGPLGGAGVGFGSYLSLGDALVRTPLLDGFVVNDAEAGATTFTRPTCFADFCPPFEWHGYEHQLQRALLRVAVRDPANPASVLFYNAKYVVISLPNDCLHSNAMGVPQLEAQQCSTADMNAMIDRLKAVAAQAQAAGLTPVFTGYPAYRDADLALTQQLFGFAFVIDEERYEEMRALHRSRLTSEVPGALYVDAWSEFEHLGDGIHPTPRTSKKAARKVALAILLDQARQR